MFYLHTLTLQPIVYNNLHFISLIIIITLNSVNVFKFTFCFRFCVINYEM